MSDCDDEFAERCKSCGMELAEHEIDDLSDTCDSCEIERLHRAIEAVGLDLWSARRRAALALWGWAGAEREARAARELSFDGAECLTHGRVLEILNNATRDRIRDGLRANRAERRLAALEAACRAKDEALRAGREDGHDTPWCEVDGRPKCDTCKQRERIDSALSAGDYERAGTAGKGEAGKDILSDLASALDAIAAPATVMDGATPEAMGRAQAVAAMRRWIEERRSSK